MALDASVLKGIMTTKIAAAVIEGGGSLASIDPVLQAISEAIVEHFTSAAVVEPAGVPPMLAPAGGGPVTGTGKVT
jgi:hypothetical protein